MENERLFRVTAPHFCAGLVVGEDSRVVAAAPVLQWAIGEKWIDAYAYVVGKGWTMEHIYQPVISPEWLKVKMAIEEGRL